MSTPKLNLIIKQTDHWIWTTPNLCIFQWRMSHPISAQDTDAFAHTFIPLPSHLAILLLLFLLLIFSNNSLLSSPSKPHFSTTYKDHNNQRDNPISRQNPSRPLKLLKWPGQPERWAQTIVSLQKLKQLCFRVLNLTLSNCI